MQINVEVPAGIKPGSAAPVQIAVGGITSLGKATTAVSSRETNRLEN